MSFKVKHPSGQEIEFADGTSDDDIASAMDQIDQEESTINLSMPVSKLDARTEITAPNMTQNYVTGADGKQYKASEAQAGKPFTIGDERTVGFRESMAPATSRAVDAGKIDAEQGLAMYADISGFPTRVLGKLTGQGDLSDEKTGLLRVPREAGFSMLADKNASKSKRAAGAVLGLTSSLIEDPTVLAGGGLNAGVKGTLKLLKPALLAGDKVAAKSAGLTNKLTQKLIEGGTDIAEADAKAISKKSTAAIKSDMLKESEYAVQRAKKLRQDYTDRVSKMPANQRPNATEINTMVDNHIASGVKDNRFLYDTEKMRISKSAKELGFKQKGSKIEAPDIVDFKRAAGFDKSDAALALGMLATTGPGPAMVVGLIKKGVDPIRASMIVNDLAMSIAKKKPGLKMSMKLDELANKLQSAGSDPTLFKSKVLQSEIRSLSNESKKKESK